MLILQFWQQISRLINGSGAADEQVLAYNATTKRFEPVAISSLIGQTLFVLHETVGGAAAEVVTLSGVEVGDVVCATLAEVGNTPRTIVTALVTDDDEVTVTFSGDPAADHVVNIIVHKSV